MGSALQDLAARLAIPGLPDWVGLVLLLLIGLVILAYLLMPFSVFGVKGRLDGIEAQLDEIQAELRALAMRMPEAPRGGGSRRNPAAPPVEDDWVAPPPPRQNDYVPPRPTPPIPPPAHWPEAPAPASQRTTRNEPRLDWPRTPPPR